MLCEGAVGVETISVRNMACWRGDESFRENAHKEYCCARCEKLETLEPHARKNCACDCVRGECTVYNTRRLQGNRHLL